MIRNSKKNTDSTDNVQGVKLRHVFFCLLMILALLSLVSYSPQDWNALNGGIAVPPANWIGSLGARFSHFLLISLGFAGYVAVLLLLLRSIRIFFSGGGSVKSFLTGMVLVTAGATLLFALSPEIFASIARPFGLGRREEPLLVISGGVIGQFFAAPPYRDLPGGIMTHFLGGIGTMIIGWALVISGGVILFVSDWHDLIRKFISSSGNAVGEGAGAFSNFMKERRRRMEELDSEDDNDDDDEEIIEENVSRPVPGKNVAAAAELEKETKSWSETDTDITKGKIASLYSAWQPRILIIDADFIYEEGKLKTKGKPFFLKENLLYQGLVRTKEKVVVICYRNQNVFRQIIKKLGKVN